MTEGTQHAVMFGAHCDDVVLSAGQLLVGRPGTRVVTVFAGDPPDPRSLAPCDVRSGFHNSGDGMAARRAEDRRALGILEARPVHLVFPENAYRSDPPDRASIVEAMRAQIDPQETVAVFLPLGLRHPDHSLVHECGLAAVEGHWGQLWLYEDLPYRVQWPEDVPEVLEAVRARGLEVWQAFAGSGDKDRKRLAVSMYVSQHWQLDLDCVFVPERFWLVKR